LVDLLIEARYAKISDQLIGYNTRTDHDLLQQIYIRDPQFNEKTLARRRADRFSVDLADSKF